MRTSGLKPAVTSFGRMRSFGRLAALLGATALSACASRAGGGDPAAPASQPAASAEAPADDPSALQRAGRTTSQAVSVAGTTAREGLPAAATAPLEDLNLNREEIPISLAAIDYVYEAYPPPDCADIAIEIARLDTDLGRDYDAEPLPEESLGQRGGEAVGDLVVDTIRGVTTDVIPFRSAVREVSGAASFERRRARAYAAGYARRAYLKGLALGQGCLPPASPRVLTAPEKAEEQPTAATTPAQ
jgi:hypothetical protein